LRQPPAQAGFHLEPATYCYRRHTAETPMPWEDLEEIASAGPCQQARIPESARINEVEISSAGIQAVSVERRTILTLNNGAYKDAVMTAHASIAYSRSCGISDDRNWVWVSLHQFQKQSAALLSAALKYEATVSRSVWRVCPTASAVLPR
jgi:hypothetical protein